MRGLGLALMGSLFLTACKNDPPDSAVVPSEEEASPNSVPPDAPFALYATLAGKMARIEELLNGIERFLGESDFQTRLLADVGELHQLLTESKGLYPDELEPKDQVGYDQAMGRAITSTQDLQTAIQAQNQDEALTAIESLHKIRRKAHARFSY